MNFSKYCIELTLIRDMLGTNPCDPNVMDSHIHEKQRKLILEKSKINNEVNRYLDALEITKEKTDEEKNRIIDSLENLTGLKITKQERLDALAGKLDVLKETFGGLDMTGTTIFMWDKEKNLPCIGDHMIYGFLKAAGEAICRTRTKKNSTMLQSIAYTCSIINQHVRLTEHFITFDKDIKRDEAGNPIYLQRSLRAKTPQGDRIALAKSEIVPAGAKLRLTMKVMENSPFTESVLKEILDYGQDFCGLGQWRNSGYGMFTHELMQG